MQSKSEEGERTVTFGEVSNDEAKELMKQQPGFGNVPGAIPKFKKEESYTNFLAEYALIDGNVVVHFYNTPERPWDDQKYWREQFPSALNEQGQLHFQATFPRLKAKLTEEVKSWWFEAQNYEHVIDLEVFMSRFFDRLDAQIDATLAQ